MSATARIPVVDPASGELCEPMAASDPYALLGFAPAAVLDPEELRRRYLEFSRLVHPDRYARLGSAQLARAHAWATVLNRAYHTLADIETRLLFLIEQAALTPAHAKRTEVSAALLAETFDLQEMLEEEGLGHGNPELRARIEQERQAVAARMDDDERKLAELAKRWDADVALRASIAQDILACLDRRRYRSRLLAPSAARGGRAGAWNGA